MERHALELLELPAILERLAASRRERGGRGAGACARADGRRRRGGRPAGPHERGDRAARPVRRARARGRLRRHRRGRDGGARQRPRSGDPVGDRPLDRDGARRAGRARGARRGPAARGHRGRDRPLARRPSRRRSARPSSTTAPTSATARRPPSGACAASSASGRARLAERLRAFARDPRVREHLQDDFVTERGGRPVLALKATARAAVPGIVHDSSGSGQTLFVEPFAVVDESNRLREAESAEREEVERILRELSRRVGEHEAALAALVEASRGSTSRSRAAALPQLAGRAGRDRGRRSSCAAPAIRCSTRRPRCRSTSSSARCARS